jgi:shikimate kinase
MGLIFITGMSGSGKTTVGEQLAAALNVPFVDLDEKISRATGRRIPQIFAEEGESAFREREALALRRVVRASEGVIALGAGALERDSNFELVHAYGKLVYLRAPIELLAERLCDSKARPLLAGVHTRDELEHRLLDMLARREPRYATAQTTIEITRETTVAETVETLCRILKRT